MSDLMFFAVLRMPYEMAMEGEISRYQFWSSVQGAVDRLQRAEREVASLRQRAERAEADAEMWAKRYSNAVNAAAKRAPDLLKLQNSAPVVVIRKACLMEDEGHDHMIGSHLSEEDANFWIQSQAGKYFAPSNYYIKSAKHPSDKPQQASAASGKADGPADTLRIAACLKACNGLATEQIALVNVAELLVLYQKAKQEIIALKELWSLKEETSKYFPPD